MHACMHAHRFIENLGDSLGVMDQIGMGFYSTQGCQTIEGATQKTEAVPPIEPGFQVPWRRETFFCTAGAPVAAGT